MNGMPKHDPTVRPLEPRDIAAVAGLCHELGYPSTAEEVAQRARGLGLFGAGTPGAATAGPATAGVATAGPATAGPAAAAFVADVDGGVAGFVQVQVVRTLESDAFVEIAGLVVTAALRGRGIGRRLVAAGEAWALARGVGAMRVRSRTTRADAHAFYAAAGYAPAKTQVVFVRPLRPMRAADAGGGGSAR